MIFALLALKTLKAGSRRIRRSQKLVRLATGRCQNAQFSEQWCEMRLIGAPAPQRRTIDRAPHLGCAGGTHRALRLVKGDAARIPVEPAMLDQLPRRPFQIGDYIL